MMKKTLFLFFAASALASGLFAETTSALIDSTMKTCKAQALGMLKNLEKSPGKMPRTFEGGKLVLSGVNWWCSGFFPGTLWYLYEYDGDPVLKEAAERYTKMVETLLTKKTDHDIGFQFNCSFGNGYRITGTERYKHILIEAAKKLCARFDEKVGCIRSWDSDNNGKWQYPVIIDNMMNLELLEFAAKNTGDAKFENIAKSHADKTIQNHFRPDNSSVHVVSYDRKTGKPHLTQTWQGLSDSSAWARGQAWGFYGYTMMYRETSDESYLKQAEKIARFIMGHKNLPEDKIPYWDFDADGGENTLRDASAGAIMASAFIELSTLTKDASLAAECRKTAETQIRSLASPKYLAGVGENGNFFLKHSVGAIPFKSEVDVPLTYADYYFLEAMLRWKNANK